MGIPLRVLLVEDSEDDAAVLLLELRRGGYDPACERVETAEEMQAALARRPWDLVLADYSLPRFGAPAAFTRLQESGLDLPFIIVSGVIGEDVAVKAMKAGAHDYIMKGNLTRLTPAIAREVREAEVRRERKQLEEQFRQSQKMEAIGRLAGGVAHDFNNMLTVIKGRSQLLQRRLALDESQRRDVDLISEAVDKAASLTRQLLAFSRKQVLQPRVLDLNAVVAGMKPMLEPLIGEHILMRTALAPGLGTVKADPGQIEQIIMNLAVNARDAMPDGGQLTIETANAELDAAYCRYHDGTRPGPYVMQAVSDTGIGMDAETRAHLFEPFFTTKGPDKGTGLGLATVYGIVKQSSGAISVSSEPGRGTVFKIYLPRVDEPVELVEPEKVFVGPLHGSETVLLAEDEEGVRTTVREILQMQGYTVLEARHGGEAFAISEQHQGLIHLLVTDAVMPQMGGRELAQRLAPVRPEMKVLYLSGYSDDTVVEVVLGAAFLEKPFAPDALVRKVREVLGPPRGGTA